MGKFELYLETYIEPFMEKVDENKVMSALKAGSMATTPFLFLGGFVMIVINFPGLETFHPELHTWLTTILSPLVDCTFGLSGLIMLVGIAVAYAKELEVHTVYATVTALLCFMLVTPFRVTQNMMVDGTIQSVRLEGVLSIQAFGFRSMITAIIISLVSVRIFALVFHRNLIFKMPKSVPPMVFHAFTTIIPASIALLLFTLVRILLSTTPFDSLTDCIYSIVITPLLGVGNNIFSFIGVTQILANSLWFFGIHGTNAVQAIWGPILQTMEIANLEALRAGIEFPYILSDAFRTGYGITNVYVIMITMLLVMKSKRMKKVAKMSLVPAIFCVSEPMMFGLPIFMNPILLFPFIVCSSVQFTIAYFLCTIGFAPIPIIPTPWTTPIFLNILIATNWNFMGVITQLILLVVGVFIWYPFLRTLDHRYVKEEREHEKLS